MSEASKRRKHTARHEAEMTGRVWESERARKRRIASEQARKRQLDSESRQGFNGNAAALLNSAARFAERDDKARSRRRYYRIDPARGDGGKVEPKDSPVIIYNESARSLLGY